MAPDPFHEGEIAVQERAGQRDIGRRRHTIISPRIVPGALPFLAEQRLIALSVTGPDAHLWTSVWCGRPGFVRSEDGERVTIRRSLTTIAPGDPVLGRLDVGRDLTQPDLVLVDQGEPRTLGGEQAGRGRADARRRAGDDGYFVLELHGASLARWGRATPVARSSSLTSKDAPLKWRAPSEDQAARLWLRWRRMERISAAAAGKMVAARKPAIRLR